MNPALTQSPRCLTMVGMMALALHALPAQSGSVDTVMNASYTLKGACSGFTAGNTMDMAGNAGTDPTNLSSSTEVGVFCSAGAPWTVTVQTSAQGGAADYICDGAGRVSGGLVNGAGKVAARYRLYKDAGFTSLLGTTPACGTATGVTGQGNAQFQAVDIYARIISGDATAPPDTYQSVVTLMLSF